jgi:hypothetical protein
MGYQSSTENIFCLTDEHGQIYDQLSVRCLDRYLFCSTTLVVQILLARSQICTDLSTYLFSRIRYLISRIRYLCFLHDTRGTNFACEVANMYRSEHVSVFAYQISDFAYQISDSFSTTLVVQNLIKAGSCYFRDLIYFVRHS